jgi:hypothetical protein
MYSIIIIIIIMSNFAVFVSYYYKNIAVVGLL